MSRPMSLSQLFGVDFQSYLAYSNPRFQGVALLPHVAPRRHGPATMLILCRIGVTLKGRALEPGMPSPQIMRCAVPFSGERSAPNKNQSYTAGYWSHRQCGAQIVSNLISAERRLKLF